MKYRKKPVVIEMTSAPFILPEDGPEGGDALGIGTV